MNITEILENLNSFKVIDCTHSITPTIPIWPGGQRLEKKTLRTYQKDGFAKEIFIMGNDLGTHIDSPSHFIEGKETISDISISKFVCPAVIIDVSTKVLSDNEYMLTKQDLTEWEEANGIIPDNSIVCMKTGWSARFHDEKQYQNLDEKGLLHFPAFSKEAAEFLVNERNINGIGVDTLSTDSGTATIPDVHNTILGAGKYQIENLDLSNIKIAKVLMIALPLKVEGAPEAETRVIAIIN